MKEDFETTRMKLEVLCDALHHYADSVGQREYMNGFIEKEMLFMFIDRFRGTLRGTDMSTMPFNMVS